MSTPDRHGPSGSLGRHTFVEMEYKDPSRRGRYIVIIGVILALVAGGAAFYLINQAQQQAGQAGLQRVAVVVAAKPIPARKLIEATDVAVREIPIDPTNAQGIVSTPDKVIGRVPAVAILEGQMVTTNILASSVEGGQFTVLGPDETVGLDERPRRPRGRWPAPTDPDRGCVRDRQRERADGFVHRHREGRLLLGQVDQDH